MFKNLKFLSLILALAFCLQIAAQENFPYNGVADERSTFFLLKDATIYPGESKAPFQGDVLLQDGKIINVGTEIKHKGAVEVDLNGYYVYPSFIDLYAQYGIKSLKPDGVSGPQLYTDKAGAYSSNEAIKSEFNAYEGFVKNETEAKSWRAAGFGAVLTHRMDGISRGSGALVALGNQNEHEVILKPKATNHLSLRKGTSTQDYPSSKMGAIALLKQTYHDGKWYAKEHQDFNISLEQWNKLQHLPTIIEASNVLDALRVDKIGDEFGKQYIIRGSGDEYQKIEGIKGTNASFIIPINFPEAVDVEDPWNTEMVNLATLKHWELAPFNLKLLSDNNIKFSITTNRLKDKSDFLKNIRLAVNKGLSADKALNALTIVPAQQINASATIGSIAKGKWANLLVSDKPIFEEDAQIIQNWVQGKLYQINAFNAQNFDGKYNFQVGKEQYKATLSQTASAPSFILHLNDTSDVKVSFTLKENQVNLSFALPDEAKQNGYNTLIGWKQNNHNFKGKGRLSNGQKVSWQLTKLEDITPNPKVEDESEEETLATIIYPFVSYGNEIVPTAKQVLFKNATVWTNEQNGILNNADVLISNGKIVKVGTNLSAPEAEIVDATGKHLTAGIIDEHSHIGIQGGVNEGTEVSSAEVSIGDVINSEDVNFYRQLAGGVVAAQLLHGSANPIGGQSAIVKFRWGSLPEQMKIKDAAPFIKFALGENVKQSNWGYDYSVRFPQTRMGVEQVFVDYFTRAKAYGEDKNPNKRIDLDLETVNQILNSKRFITCHSYVQSEINMLMKVAEQFDFRVNTFTHILEGYKVADKMKEHGVGASTFSDWWAYKYEVIDAIPYNAALLHEMGVLTALNSDDAEMGRRLNQEAAKTVKYGNVSEEEAWKMVTLNPAKLLHLDHRMGSIKVGKDADIVLWSENPLSVYAKAEQTYVDGVKYFDREEDKVKQQWLTEERARLIQKMLVAKKGGANVIPVQPKEDKHYHCDDLEHWDSHEH